jgi:hypothetical protein
MVLLASLTNNRLNLNSQPQRGKVDPIAVEAAATNASLVKASLVKKIHNDLSAVQVCAV